MVERKTIDIEKRERWQECEEVFRPSLKRCVKARKKFGGLEGGM